MSSHRQKKIDRFTLIETLLGALLAAAIFSMLLATLISFGKASRKYTAATTSALQQAELHTALKQLFALPKGAHLSAEFDEGMFSRITIGDTSLFVLDKTLYLKEKSKTPKVLAKDVSSFSILFYTQTEKGGIVTKSTWEEKTLPFGAVCILNNENYPLLFPTNLPEIRLCK